jgi:hypothetical protein
MKKGLKKLTLCRETLRVMSHYSLRMVAGGASFNCHTTCRCPDDPGTFSADCTVDCPTTSLG